MSLKRIVKLLAFALSSLALAYVMHLIYQLPSGALQCEIVPPRRTTRIIILLLLPLVASVACSLLELGFKHEIRLRVSQAVSQVALLILFLVALSFFLEQHHQTGSPLYLEFPKSDFGVKGEMKCFRFKVDSYGCAFLAGATLLTGVCSIGGFINQPMLHPLTQTVIFFTVQVVLSNSFLQTFVVWCGLSVSCQLLSFFYSGGIKMAVWWGMPSRSGCYPMLFLVLFALSVYGTINCSFVMALTALGSSSHLTAFGGGLGIRLMDAMLGLIFFAALGPALEAFYYASSGKQTPPRVYFLEIVVMGAVGCFLLQSWRFGLLLKHSSILGPIYKLLIALFFGS